MEDFLAPERPEAGGLVDEIFREFGSLSDALAASPAKLAKVVGAGPARRLQSFKQLKLAVLAERVRARPWISVEEMAQILNLEIGFATVEHFYAFYLDISGALIHSEVVSSGATASMLVEPRNVILRAVERGSSAIVVAHNHPSGLARPSSADVQLTDRLERMAADFEIRLVDHLIAARGKVCSIKRGSLISCRDVLRQVESDDARRIGEVGYAL